MRLSFPPILLLLLYATLPAISSAQGAKYVTDALKLEARSGPSTEHRVVRMLDTGHRLEVKEERDGWSRVLLEGGAEVWMLSRYLQDTPVARTLVEEAIARQKQAVGDSATMKSELETLRATATALEESRDEFSQKSRTLAAELASIKKAAAEAIAIQEENERLSERTRTLETNLASAERESGMLRAGRERDWFIAGAGVLVFGMLLGLVIPKIRWQRRRSWDQL
ncbi:MAG: TIGR04211 family SH3 domain-containing protein [Gammaproteobacteria bacterium]|nr:TIGR04211 family SH3 domain-containing protein [Gammaproteobacteria bacterium]